MVSACGDHLPLTRRAGRSILMEGKQPATATRAVWSAVPRLSVILNRETAMATFDDVWDAARDLPLADRVRLIDALWESLPTGAGTAPNEEWVAEAQRRSAEVDAGRMPAAPWPEVRRRARRKAGLDG
jgi:putative addiction module component (TIGR02574 family)